MPPMVSVVMPVYNGERFLAAAVESILAQTLGDFEFIIVDDGSDDSTWDILSGYAQCDSRILLQRQPRNLGLVAALNRGCRAARGEFIARMDADDISLPHRFQTQIDFLKRNADIDLVASAADIIDADGQIFDHLVMPSGPGIVGFSLILGHCCLVHSSVFVRRRSFEKVDYYPNVPYVEDYAMWARMSLSERFYNLPDTLVGYRVWDRATSLETLQAQQQGPKDISAGLMAHYLGRPVPEPVAATLRYLSSMRLGAYPTSLEQIMQSAQTLEALYDAYTGAVPLSAVEERDTAFLLAKGHIRLGLFAAKYSLFDAARLMLAGIRRSPRTLRWGVQTIWKRLL